MREAVILVEHLSKQYKKAGAKAVDDISFTVQPGEFFAFLGPNGAGKTTTISVLTTTLAKTSGRVSIAGHDLDREAVAVRRCIGIIFQNPSLDLNLTAEENIRLHASLYGLYGYRPFYRLMPAGYRRHVESLADIVGIRDSMFKPLKSFSGGMKRKLEIVRSLLHRPSILFLDEPTAGLDPVSRASLWQYLQQMRHDQVTTIFLTTHYLEEAEGSDRVCVIANGKIVLTDTPAGMKRRLLNRSVVLDAADRAALEAELARLGVPYVIKDGGFTIPLTDATPQQLIARLTTPLTVLRLHEPSLEEAYVEIIASHDAGGEMQ
jgi:ABC-2 type transport system ATP-binding protein